jgi:hypothetical protein
MADESGRTLVCSVLFLDLIGYSKKAVAEQHEVKHQFNSALTEALDLLQRRDRLIVDTGDGAAVVFLGDPEDAMIVGMAMRESSGRVPMRLGINLGPVRPDQRPQRPDQRHRRRHQRRAAHHELRRAGAAAGLAQLLRSGDARLRALQALFVRVGMVQDKHVRDHDIYLVDDDIRLNEDPLAPPRPEPPRRAGPAKVVDTGTALMISGSRAAVERRCATWWRRAPPRSRCRARSGALVRHLHPSGREAGRVQGRERRLQARDHRLVAQGGGRQGGGHDFVWREAGRRDRGNRRPLDRRLRHPALSQRRIERSAAK